MSFGGGERKFGEVNSTSRYPASVRSADVELGEALFVLSDALDLVGVDDVLHGKRVCWLSLQLLEVVGEEALMEDLHHAALIHDCGVSSTRHHLKLVAELSSNDAHCEAGARLVGQFGPLAHLADAIRYHHTPWPQLEALDQSTAKIANLVFLADRIDVLQARYSTLDPADLRGLVEELLFGQVEHWFAPEFVDAARVVLGRDQVARLLKSRTTEGCSRIRSSAPRLLTPADVKGLANLFAQTVDAKSEYTARHSHGVGALAAHLGTALGLPKADVETLEVAALLHDLGKLQVPDEVLDKPGPLDDDEWVMMRRHAHASWQILSRIGGFARIAEIAGMHHEFLDGGGYPIGLKGDSIPLEARIVTVADIFQALAQRRPYRRALEPKLILSILKDHASRGQVDGSVVHIIESDLGFAWRLCRVVEDDEPQPQPPIAVTWSLSG